MTDPANQPSKKLSPLLKYFMALACGVIVANLYYCQPLLGRLARNFSVDEEAASWINICCQLGYGLGLFFIVPLGDMVSRRKLLVVMQICAAAATCGAALSPALGYLFLSGIAMGAASTACQVFVPLGAHLASDEERGKVIGTLMGGLLSGILLSRTLSGFIADVWGWRSVYWMGAVLMIITTTLTAWLLPEEHKNFKGTYRQLLRSIFGLVRQYPEARQSAWMGACLFGAIAAFWSTMAFFLEKPPYSFSVSVIGLFGVVGLSGVLISPLAGRISDKVNPFVPMRWGLLAMSLGYLLLFWSRSWIGIFILGIVLIDMGLQAAHIPNLARVNTLQPDARTRLNTIYMTAFFMGGTLGSIFGSYAWTSAGWNGVCIVGLSFVAAGSLPLFRRPRRRRSRTT